MEAPAFHPWGYAICPKKSSPIVGVTAGSQPLGTPAPIPPRKLGSGIGFGNVVRFDGSVVLRQH